MRDGWVREGWPGPLDPENEAVMEWARVARTLSPAAADARYEVPVDEGNEPLVVRRQVAAAEFVKGRAWTDIEEALEAQRGD